MKLLTLIPWTDALAVAWFLAVWLGYAWYSRRRRDLDNILKSLLDSLTHAGVWEDDSQITDLRIRKGPHIAGMVVSRLSSMCGLAARVSP